MSEANQDRAGSGPRRGLAGLVGVLVVLAGLAWWAGVGGASGDSTDAAPQLPAGVANQRPGETGRPDEHRAAQVEDGRADAPGGAVSLAERLPAEQVRVLSLRVVRRTDKSPLREGVKVILTTGPDPGAEVLDARIADSDGLSRCEIPAALVTPDAGFLIVWQPVTFVPSSDSHIKAFANRVARAWVPVDSLKSADGTSVPVVELDTGCRLAVLVVDDARSPVSQSQVRMGSGAPDGVTDVAGLAVLEDVPRGGGVVVCHKQGFCDGTAVVDVGTEDIDKRITVVIHRDSDPR